MTDQDKRDLRREIVSSALDGDHLKLLKILVPLSNRLDNTAIGEVNEVLHAASLPSVDELLVNARVELITDPSSKQRLPAPSAREGILLLTGIQKRIEAVRVTLDARLNEMLVKLPNDFLDYSQWQQRTYMLQRQLHTTGALAEYAAGVTANKRRMLLQKDLTAEQQAAIAFDYGEAASQLRARREQLIAAEFKQRIDRLRDAESVLRLSGDHSERFAAACSLADDELRFPSTNPASSKPVQSSGNPREEAQRAQIAEIATLTARAREAAGQRLVFQAQQFTEGLNWWNRGRYGQGSMANGMLKPAAAKRWRGALITLQMPVEPPVAVDPQQRSSQSSDANVDRRHHQAWNWENRRIYVSRNGSGSSETLSSQTTTTTLWQVKFSADSAAQLAR